LEEHKLFRPEMAMTTLLLVVFSTVLLAASPMDGLGGGDSDQAAKAQAFSMAAGVLGAATGCDQIARDQLSETAKMVSALAAAQANDLDELSSIRRLLMVSAAAGRQALQDGKTDCKTVEASFQQLEQVVLQTPI
jgi:hypothetical protein